MSLKSVDPSSQSNTRGRLQTPGTTSFGYGGARYPGRAGSVGHPSHSRIAAIRLRPVTLSFRWRDAPTAQDLADRARADPVSQAAQFALDADNTPGPVLSGEP